MRDAAEALTVATKKIAESSDSFRRMNVTLGKLTAACTALGAAMMGPHTDAMLRGIEP